jgi:hypothetical protein
MITLDGNVRVSRAFVADSAFRDVPYVRASACRHEAMRVWMSALHANVFEDDDDNDLEVGLELLGEWQTTLGVIEAAEADVITPTGPRSADGD